MINVTKTYIPDREKYTTIEEIEGGLEDE